VRFVQVSNTEYINLSNVTDILIGPEPNEIFFFGFMGASGAPHYVTASRDFAPDLIKALRNQTYPFSDNRG